MRALAAVADEEHELVGVMSGRLDLEERATSDGGAERDEELGEDRDRVSLGVRRDRADDLAEQLVIDRPLGRGRPPGGRGEHRAVCRFLGWLVEE